jgi:hypothetical protein
MRDFFNACRLTVGLPGMVEGIPEYFLRVRRQMIANRRRKVFVACIRHTRSLVYVSSFHWQRPSSLIDVKVR